MQLLYVQNKISTKKLKLLNSSTFIAIMYVWIKC